MKYIISACFMLLTNLFFAQHITGKIINTDNKPIEEVSVFNKTTEIHTHTSSTGVFTLNKTKENDTLYISRLGYEAKIIRVDENDLNAPLTITLNPANISLDQVMLLAEIDLLSKFVAVDVQTDPVKSSQEILRKVPGLIIGQHAGGGKAEQIFLRGFDIDHGTDINLTVDGLPVNMVSHAHGQGYSDLHFVIPETIENIDFGKGPYYADKGNFTTAGYVNLGLKKSIDKNYLSLEAGQFNSNRLMGMFNVLDTEKSSAYIASELSLTDGPFDSPQNFNRFNILGRYNYKLAGDQEVSFTASHFQSKWDASGQIPQRAVDDGSIDRFGSIDDTEGGETSRTNLLVNHTKAIDANQSLETTAYVSQYNFELYSNFTFFLDDPINGDQIKQFENRLTTGASTVYEHRNIELGENTIFKYQAGIGFRYDNADDVELSHTLNRKTVLDYKALGDVDEVNTYAFLNTEFKTGKWTFNPSARIDYFKFQYEDQLSVTYSDIAETKVRVSPKLNTIYSVNEDVQLFLNTGMGFHSNDSRVVIANQGESILPAAYGADLGTILKPTDKLAINASLWYLFLEQEFVYVGDAAIVEPSGRTQRLGVDVGARYQALDWLYLYSDANYAHGRSVDDPSGENYIPLAPDFTTVGGILVDNLGAFSGGLNYRYVDDRPANEDNSIVAEGYFVTDFNVNYTCKNWTYSIIVENLFNTEWNETQFATESRLYDEPAPVEEIHFTPGTPFFIRAKIALSF
ncbi:TonB-dependent receptor plug domain-containing protein [Tamlana sp. 2_MG-2023]|uniref:TonB-dependent receptor n=1 Tax=unclassified Tamlana TaxID=2614803 RepID=UPI0026E3A2D3|nr:MULTISPECIES: TonB-dependent receptor plug domain-containing protein [unclassified Tamlana]MDO6760409.1 TonB-dependent receptor plug domain-containing protein [Tamlana sp. 2_MG-2023]MDO6789892.1 TonB-dependent receptor plug domain-containing protein [Tamlana sp. 1_MG-2023]